jgi:hypothetical protein
MMTTAAAYRAAAGEVELTSTLTKDPGIAAVVAAGERRAVARIARGYAAAPATIGAVNGSRRHQASICLDAIPLVAHDVRMTSNRMNWIRATLGAVLATSMMACATTRATPRAAAAPDDQTLKTRVQTSLMNATGVHGNEVTAEVTQAVATLSGTVHSQAEADAAVAAARRVDGVKDVRSNLRVQ